jgi:hypothetical protein
MLVFTVSVARANVILLPSDSANYAVLDEGAGNHTLTVNTSTISNSFGTYSVLGNIGLGMENGGNPQMSFQNGRISGNINFAATNTPANYTHAGGTLNGSVNTGVSQVEADLNALNTLSQNLGGLAGSNLTINLTGSGGSQTIAASNGAYNATYGAYVFNLTSLTFVSGNTLTINGQNLGANVILNVNSANVSGPHFNGAITLSGGLTPEEFIINLTGGNNAALTGGPILQNAANNAYQYATYLDPNGSIQVTTVNLIGHLFGGDSSDMVIASGATVAVPEPDNITLAVLGCCVCLVAWRSQRRSPTEEFLT